MSFYGKKFRRTHCENIEELLSASKANEQIASVLRCKPPVLRFTRDGNNLHTDMYLDHRHVKSIFTLGQEKVMERIDGTSIKITITEESENVLKQVITMPDGKRAYFRREFGERDAKLIIHLDGTDIAATVYFEVVE